MNDRLYRSVDDRVVAGVAGGVAERFDIDPSLVRVAWVILTLITGGVFLVIYIVMAIVVPEAPRGAARWASWSHEPGPDAVPGWNAPGSQSAGTPTGGASSGAPGGPGPAGGPGSPDPAAGPEAAAPGGAAPGGAPAPGNAAVPGWSGWESRHRRRDRDRHGSGPIVVGVLLVLAGLYFLIGTLLPDISLGAYWPVVLIVIGVALLIGSVRPGSGADDR